MDVTFMIPSPKPCILKRVNAKLARSRPQKKHMLPAARILAGLCVIAGCTSPATATPAASGSRADPRATASGTASATASGTAPASPPSVTVVAPPNPRLINTA
jgi:hypothetical protein